MRIDQSVDPMINKIRRALAPKKTAPAPAPPTPAPPTPAPAPEPQPQPQKKTLLEDIFRWK